VSVCGAAPVDGATVPEPNEKAPLLREVLELLELPLEPELDTA